MQPALQATLTKTYRGEPLAVVDNLPGGGAELRPEQLRALAAALLQIATDCEAQPAKGRKPLPTVRRQYPMSAA